MLPRLDERTEEYMGRVGTLFLIKTDTLSVTSENTQSLRYHSDTENTPVESEVGESIIIIF